MYWLLFFVCGDVEIVVEKGETSRASQGVLCRGGYTSIRRAVS